MIAYDVKMVEPDPKERIGEVSFVLRTDIEEVYTAFVEFMKICAKVTSWESRVERIKIL